MTQTTNLRDGIKPVKPQGETPRAPGSENRGAPAPLGGQAGTEKQEG